VCDASELELAKTTPAIRRPSYRPVQTETAPSGQLCCKRAATLVICQPELANWQLGNLATWQTGNLGKRQCHNADATATAFDFATFLADIVFVSAPVAWLTKYHWVKFSPGMAEKQNNPSIKLDSNSSLPAGKLKTYFIRFSPLIAAALIYTFS